MAAAFINPAVTLAGIAWGVLVSVALHQPGQHTWMCCENGLANDQSKDGEGDGTGDAEKRGVEDHQPDATSPMSVSLVSGACVWSPGSCFI